MGICRQRLQFERLLKGFYGTVNLVCVFKHHSKINPYLRIFGLKVL